MVTARGIEPRQPRQKAAFQAEHRYRSRRLRLAEDPLGHQSGLFECMLRVGRHGIGAPDTRPAGLNLFGQQIERVRPALVFLGHVAVRRALRLARHRMAAKARGFPHQRLGRVELAFTQSDPARLVFDQRGDELRRNGGAAGRGSRACNGERVARRARFWPIFRNHAVFQIGDVERVTDGFFPVKETAHRQVVKADFRS